MKKRVLNFQHQQHEKILLTEGGASLPFFPCLKTAQKNCRTVKASTFSGTIKTATPPSAVNTERGLSNYLDSLKRLGAPMNILLEFVPLGNGRIDQHPQQTMQGGAV